MADHTRTVSLLLVEDSRYFAELIGEFLCICDKAGFEVTHVTSLGDAKSRLDLIPADVVLSDVRLPDADTDQLFDWMANQTAQRPIVLMTGMLDPRLRDRARRAGCVDCVDKDDLVTAALGDRLLTYIAAFGGDGRT